MFSKAIPQNTTVRTRQLSKVLWVTLGLNIGVALLKLGIGLWSGCVVIVADSIHSLSDASSNIVGLVGIAISSKPADKTHPYGHEKYETLAATVIAVFLFLAAYGILKGAITGFFETRTPNISILTFSLMFLTLLVNIFVVVYERHYAKLLNSDLLHSDAWHTLTDVIVTLFVFVSLLAMHLGIPKVDSVASIMIACFIIWTAFGILKQGSDVLCDKAVLDEQWIAAIVKALPKVKDCHEIRTRGRNDTIYVDLHVMVDPQMSVSESHRLSHAIENEIRSKQPSVREVVIHVEPDSHEHDETTGQSNGC